jgi:capsular polysaccharide transport system permease protein
LNKTISYKPIKPLRNPFQITFSVWRALFLREAVSRLSSERFSWFWVITEPIFHMSYLLLIYTVFRIRTVAGVDTVIWLIVGITGFLIFRETSNQMMHAISANQSLFSYRQVKPIDTVLVRGFLEGFLAIIILTILLFGASLFGHEAIPNYPFIFLLALLGLWLLGLGLGLCTSVITHLYPEICPVIKYGMMPLFFISGVIYPISSIPYPYQDWLMWNPIVHGIEGVRLGFGPYYHFPVELDVPYLFKVALVLMLLGLMLHARFNLKLIRK